MDNKKMEEYKDWDDITSPDEDANGNKHFRLKYYDGEKYCYEDAVFLDGVLKSELYFDDEYPDEFTETIYDKSGNKELKITTREQENDFLIRETEVYDKDGKSIVSRISEDYDVRNGYFNFDIKDPEGKEMTLESVMEKNSKIVDDLQLNFFQEVNRDKDGNVKSVITNGEYSIMNYNRYEYYKDGKIIESGWHLDNGYNDYADQHISYEEDGKPGICVEKSNWNKGFFDECTVLYRDTHDEKGMPSNEFYVQYKKEKYGVDIDFLNAKFTKDSNLEELLERVRNNAPEVITQVERDLPTFLDDIPLLENSLDEPDNDADKTQLEKKITLEILERLKSDLMKKVVKNKEELDEIKYRQEKASKKLEELNKKAPQKDGPNIG